MSTDWSRTEGLKVVSIKSWLSTPFFFHHTLPVLPAFIVALVGSFYFFRPNRSGPSRRTTSRMMTGFQTPRASLTLQVAKGHHRQLQHLRESLVPWRTRPQRRGRTTRMAELKHVGSSLSCEERRMEHVQRQSQSTDDPDTTNGTAIWGGFRGQCM